MLVGLHMLLVGIPMLLVGLPMLLVGLPMILVGLPMLSTKRYGAFLVRHVALEPKVLLAVMLYQGACFLSTLRQKFLCCTACSPLTGLGLGCLTERKWKHLLVKLTNDTMIQ
jgi:hypothetical protein